MMKISTLRKFFLKKENWLLLAMFTLLFVFGCYEFKVVDQPTEGFKNSTFDVNIVMTEDNDESNDWSYEDGSLTKHGLFGVLLPEGWTISDNIPVTIVSMDSISDGAGGWIYPTSDHGGDFVLAYNEEQTTMLNDSTQAPPPGYYWWGGKTTEPVDMAFFDSLYFTVSVLTDDRLGEFFLQYAVGDVDYWGRMPYDPNVITDPLPINIVVGVGINTFLNDAALSVYPNPSYGYLNVELAGYSGEQVDMMMYDLRGKQVMMRNITSAHTTLDVVDLKPGVYVVRLESGEETITRKFVKH
jgi:hypothetical protein